MEIRAGTQTESEVYREDSLNATCLLGHIRPWSQFPRCPVIWRWLTWVEASVWCRLGQKPEYLALLSLGSINLTLRTHENFRAFKIWIILSLFSCDLFLCLNGTEIKSDSFRFSKKTVAVQTQNRRMSV